VVAKIADVHTTAREPGGGNGVYLAGLVQILIFPVWGHKRQRAIRLFGKANRRKGRQVYRPDEPTAGPHQRRQRRRDLPGTSMVYRVLVDPLHVNRISLNPKITSF